MTILIIKKILFFNYDKPKKEMSPFYCYLSLPARHRALNLCINATALGVSNTNNKYKIMYDFIRTKPYDI